MAPQLFARQLDLGAWGITAATVAQVAVMRSMGVSRVMLANELVDPVALAWVAAELRADPEWEFHCFVDSVRAVTCMHEALRSAAVSRPVNVLVEVGRPGGRAGCRTLDESIAVCTAIAQSSTLTLSGVAGYEGAYATDLSPDALDAVEGFLWMQRRTVTELCARGFFPSGADILVTAGGSAYFDQVVEVLTRPWTDLDGHVSVVLRSGAYVTHDDEHYRVLSPFGRPGATGLAFQPALHAYSRVLSRPEPRLAILDMGKRDISYDLGLPVPQHIVRGDGSVLPITGCSVTAVNDQHAFVSVGHDTPLEVGDVVRCGLSHPCTVFDKWQVLPVLDSAGHVIDVVCTFF